MYNNQGAIIGVKSEYGEFINAGFLLSGSKNWLNLFYA